MSLLWAIASLTDEQQAALAKVRALPGDPGRPNQASGEPVKRLMAEHGIIQHGHSPHDAEYQASFDDDDERHLQPDDILHTRQSHVWKPALEQYIKHGHEHMTDPDYGGSVPYHPRTFEHGDKDWIEEGHHRILAQRMLGNSVTTKHGWSDSSDDPDHDWDEWQA